MRNMKKKIKKNDNPKKKGKSSKIKWKNLLCIAFIIVAIGLLAYSGIKVFTWLTDNQKSNEIMDEINEKVTITQEDEINTTTTQNEEEIQEDDPYWDFIKMNLIDVDLSELVSINDETVGWLKVNGTNINYPFVHTSDNKYYLTHDFYKQSNGGGWVYLDHRNDEGLNGRNNIIYAHGRANNTMFGSLKNILSSDWVNDQRNFTVQISTPSKNTLWQVFSVYKIPNTNDYIKTKFASDEDFSNFINMLINRSNFNFHTTVNKSDKILTLSTCYNDYTKVVLHAKLIKSN